MKNYLICGNGNIGHHVLDEFSPIAREFAIYDRYCKSKYEYQDYLGDKKILKKHYDIAFICVPTEMKEDGSCDISEVKWIYKRLDADVVVIKSAIPVGTARKLYNSIDSDNKRPTIVVSPEFYGTTQHSEKHPNFLILGSEYGSADPVVQLYQRVKDASFKFIFTDWQTAELTKYMENCWIATKVTFCNEFATIAKALGVDYCKLRECWLADPRVSPSHTFVYNDTPYYDSHCLNKDIPALISFTGHLSPLMQAVNKINKERKEENKTS